MRGVWSRPTAKGEVEGDLARGCLLQGGCLLGGVPALGVPAPGGGVPALGGGGWRPRHPHQQMADVADGTHSTGMYSYCGIALVWYEQALRN